MEGSGANASRPVEYPLLDAAGSGMEKVVRCIEKVIIVGKAQINAGRKKCLLERLQISTHRLANMQAGNHVRRQAQQPFGVPARRVLRPMLVVGAPPN